jgi:hypothetical protein
MDLAFGVRLVCSKELLASTLTDDTHFAVFHFAFCMKGFWACSWIPRALFSQVVCLFIFVSDLVGGVMAGG